MGSYLALNQSGMTTARRSSWMVIPRPRASSLSKVNVCSPKATMTLYDIFLHATGFSNILDFTILGSFELPCGTWQGARHIRIPPLPRHSSHIFSRLCDWSRIFVMIRGGRNLSRLYKRSWMGEFSVENSSPLLLPGRVSNHR